MPTADQHQSSSFVKALYIGDSGTGKTGSLAPLVADDYKLKILDLDNGLDYLIKEVRRQGNGGKLSNIEYETYRDTYGLSPTRGTGVVGQPKAFTNSLKKMQEWSAIKDQNTIFVLDALDALGKAAYEWAIFGNPLSKDPRQWFFTAQQMVENVLALVTGAEFEMNVIVISHVNYKEVTEGVHKGYASAIGSALGPTIPKYFNNLFLAESIGSGSNVRRKIKTVPTGVIDLKIASPEIDKELPLESGLSTIFKQLKAA